MSTLTERQAKAWPDAVAEVQRYAPSAPDELGRWTFVSWGDETRPGRGHHLDAVWTDGEHFAQVLMDVYGYPSVSVSEMSFVHASSWEECDCEFCSADRAREEA